MKNDEKEGKKQWKIMKNNLKKWKLMKKRENTNEKWWKREKQWNIIKNAKKDEKWWKREKTTMKNYEK